MATPKPALIIVPGACHQPSQYSSLQTRLETAGYETSIIDLPSTGGNKPVDGLGPDIEVIRRAIQSHINKGLNVALICHSFGGLTGSAAVEDFLPPNREDGKGVLKLIYLCAFLCPPGQAALDGTTGQHAPCVIFPPPDPKDAGFMSFRDPGQTFYAECTAEVREENVKKLRLFSEACCHDIVPHAGWKDVDSYFLLCEKDQVFPLFVQEAWSSMEGGRWKKVERIATDHSPYLSRPDETAEFVVRCLED